MQSNRKFLAEMRAKKYARMDASKAKRKAHLAAKKDHR